MTGEEAIWLRGALTAQGYLIEVLLGAQLLATTEPRKSLEQARAALTRQIRFDMHVPPTDTPSAHHLPIQAAAAQHLNEMLDRILTQWDNKGGSGGNAR